MTSVRGKYKEKEIVGGKKNINRERSLAMRSEIENKP